VLWLAKSASPTSPCTLREKDVKRQEQAHLEGRCAIYAMAITLAVCAESISQLLFPPGLNWPKLHLVSQVPWLSQGDFYSSTASLVGATVCSLCAVLLVEVAKGSRLRPVASVHYWSLVSFQLSLAVEVFLVAAPDWAAHFISMVAFGNEREVPFHKLPSTPYVSCLILSLLLLLEFAVRDVAVKAESGESSQDPDKVLID
jgi:hypothetical protein